MTDIRRAIPHRPPFLLLDEVAEVSDDEIRCRTTLRAEDPLWSGIYAGHYPENPITPGVLLCEMVFQAAAVLMSHRLEREGSPEGVPVLTRIGSAKFRSMVRPGETVEIVARFKEQVSSAFYMTGSVSASGKTAVKVDFTVALAKE